MKSTAMNCCTRSGRLALAVLLGFALSCVSVEPEARRWLDREALAGTVTLSGDVWAPSWILGRTWLEVRGPEFRVEVHVDTSGKWSLPRWPVDATPVQVRAFVGEYPRARADGKSPVVSIEPEATEVTVPTIRVRERMEARGSFAGGVTW